MLTNKEIQQNWIFDLDKTLTITINGTDIFTEIIKTGYEAMVVLSVQVVPKRAV